MDKNIHTLLLLPLFALILPFMLWPVELILPYPYIVEEVAKGICIFFVLLLPHRKIQLLYVILIGFLFALSENVLYIFNIINVGSLSFFLERLFLTTFLHIGTTLVILLIAWRKKRLIPLGVFLAGIVHYFTNIWIQSP